MATAAEVARPPFVGSFPGRVAGRYFAPNDGRPADQPVQVGFDGVGRVLGLGRVRMTGSVSFGGFVPMGQEDIAGTITLSNARGTVTLRVQGIGGNETIPGGQFQTSVSIESATGAFRRLSAIGTASFHFGGSAGADGSLSGGMQIQLRLTPPVFGAGGARSHS